jgi:periplasmic divalent cation tolerance protein
MKQKFVVVYATFPNIRTARVIVEDLVRTKRAACGNIFRLSSIYRWKGKIEKNPEYGVFIKTSMSKYRYVQRYIKKNHPYDVPEIITWNINKGNKDYLDWISEATD